MAQVQGSNGVRMLTVSDIEYAYRLFLGREPENSDVVRTLIESCESIGDLRARFLSSQEFQSHIGSSPNQRPRGDRMPVELSVSRQTLARLIYHVEGTWQELGKSEPHWSVLTHETFLSNNIEQNKSSFFSTGEGAVDELRQTADRCGIDLANYRSCFELGCGVGRVTLWLSRTFPHVVAADISGPHLELAKESLARYNRDNVTFVKLSSIEDVERLSDFDVFYSLIVLQHNPPPVIALLLSQILRKLLPGGIAYFQVPTYAVGYRFNAREYIDGLTARGMEMHVLPQDTLFQIINDCGCRLLEVREDNSTGDPNMVSNCVLAVKSR